MPPYQQSAITDDDGGSGDDDDEYPSQNNYDINGASNVSIAQIPMHKLKHTSGIL